MIIFTFIEGQEFEASAVYFSSNFFLFVNQKEFEILKRFREDSSPKDLVQIDGKPISVLKKEELVEVASRREISLLELCKIGGIEANLENLVVLVHYIITVAKERIKRPPAEQQNNEKFIKKAKTATSTVRNCNFTLLIN